MMCSLLSGILMACHNNQKWYAGAISEEDMWKKESQITTMAEMVLFEIGSAFLKHGSTDKNFSQSSTSDLSRAASVNAALGPHALHYLSCGSKSNKVAARTESVKPQMERNETICTWVVQLQPMMQITTDHNVKLKVKFLYQAAGN